VCRVLGIHVKSDGKVNTTVALAKLDRDEIGSYPIETNARNGGTRTQVAKVVNRGGLDRLIMRSDKPEARAFQDWVIRTVLPAIRKDGGYIMGEEKVVTGEMDEDVFILDTWTWRCHLPDGPIRRNAGSSRETGYVEVDLAIGAYCPDRLGRLRCISILSRRISHAARHARGSLPLVVYQWPTSCDGGCPR